MPGSNQQPNRLYLYAAIVVALVFLFGYFSGNDPLVGPGLVGCMILLAFYFRPHPTLHVLTLTLWLTISTVAALFWPQLFLEWNGFRLNDINLYLVQSIMFAMGATLTLEDFSNALRMPKAVGIGMLLQFTVMPSVGWAIAHSMGFEPEVAAGIILVGSCSGGVASNLMVFLARGNVALSVTMTACSTLMAPLMTPLLMEALAGRLIEIDFWAMVLSIINLVIIPIGGGLIVSHVIDRRRTIAVFAKEIGPLAVAFGLGVAALTGVVQLLGGATADSVFWGARLHQAAVLGGLVLLIGLVLNGSLAGRREAFLRFPPVLAMVSICAFLAIVTANSRDDLISIGLLLVLAAFLHNVIGYILGYYLAALSGIRGSNRRTIAFEVGMQNSGMAGGIALDVLRSAGAVLAPIIFSTVMDVSGSLLASWWRDRPAEETPAAT